MDKIKKKILNSLIKNGKKKTSEKIFFKILKKLKKKNKKQPKHLIELSLASTTFLFKLQKIVNKKRKKKSIKIYPIMLKLESFRISFSIKTFIKSVEKQKNIKFYKAFENILFDSLNKESITNTHELKQSTQSQALINKHFIFYYK